MCIRDREERRTPRATSRPLDHGRIHLISSRPSSTFTVALPDEVGRRWVDPRSRSKASRRVNCFDQRVGYFQSESTSSAACSSANKKLKKQPFFLFSVFPIAAVREYLQRTSFWNSLEIKLCNIALPLSSVVVFALF